MDHQRKTHTELPANVITTTATTTISIIVTLGLFFPCFLFIFAENEVGARFGSRIW